MKQNRTKKIVSSAMFAALIFIGTQFIKVPLPFGYFNFGDCFVLLSALIIGNPYAVMATSIGSVLADILSGYTIYAPATLIIKSLMVIIVIAISKLGANKNKALKSILLTIGVFCSELIMICGYFLYDTFLYGFTGALTTVSGSIIQGIIGAITCIFLFDVFERSGLIKYIIS